MHKRSVVSVSLTPRVEKNTAPKNPIIWWKYLIPYLSYLPGTLQIKVTDFAGQPNFQLTWWRDKLLCSTSASHGRDFDCNLTSKTSGQFQCSWAVLNSREHSRARRGPVSEGSSTQHPCIASKQPSLKVCQQEDTATAPSVIPAATPQKCSNSRDNSSTWQGGKVTGKVQIKLNSAGSASASTYSKSHKDTCKWFGVILVGMI